MTARQPLRKFSSRISCRQPNYTVNTSPDKFQVVWRVENISPEQAEVLQRAMARKFGSDPAATDSTRVLRVPGFLNRKYDTEFWVHAEKHTDRVYHLHDFRLRTEPIESDFRPRHHSQTPASSESRPLTQSEHDWAFAKRALARGDDPEVVIQRIADYRAERKRRSELLRAAHRYEGSSCTRFGGEKGTGRSGIEEPTDDSCAGALRHDHDARER